MTSAQGKSGHSSQKRYPFCFRFSQRMMPHLFAQNSGLFSSGPLQPGHGLSFCNAREQRLQSSPHGAIMSAVNIRSFLLAPIRPERMDFSVSSSFRFSGMCLPGYMGPWSNRTQILRNLSAPGSAMSGPVMYCRNLSYFPFHLCCTMPGHPQNQNGITFSRLLRRHFMGFRTRSSQKPAGIPAGIAFRQKDALSSGCSEPG